MKKKSFVLHIKLFYRELITARLINLKICLLMFLVKNDSNNILMFLLKQGYLDK